MTEMDVTLLSPEEDAAREFAFLEMRFRRAMQDSPGVVGYAWSQRLKFGAGGQGVRVSGTKEPPLPFREAVVDAVDEAYAQLVQWAVVWAEVLGETPPSTAAVAWRRAQVSGGEQTGDVEAIGFQAGTTPEGARWLVGGITMWLLQRHPRIVASPYAVDYMTELLRTLGGLARAHGTLLGRKIDHQQRSRVCPLCGDDAVQVSWYSEDTSDLIVQCHGCNANTAELLKVLRIPAREYARFLGWLETGAVPEVGAVPFDAGNAAHVALARREGRMDLIGGN